MGKVEKPPVDVRHICKYSDEIIAKLKDADWRERHPSGCLTNSENNVAYITDFKSFEGHLDHSFDDYSECFQIKKTTYKEWKEVELIPYNVKYGINPEKIIEVLRILHGGYKAKIMGEVVLGFTPVTWWSAKPIIMFMSYKDDYAVFIVAPLMSGDGDMELESVTIDETIPFVEPARVPFYYALKTQTIGYYYNGKILSVDEFKEEWDRKHEEYEKQLGKPPELKDRVDVLTQYFFGGFGNQLAIISGNISIVKESAFPKEKKEEAKERILKSFTWMKRKYDQIPFSELSKSPFYDDLKPLFEIKELLLTFEEELYKEDWGGAAYSLRRIAEQGKEYAKTVDKYYKELTGKSFAGLDIEARALAEYRSEEQIEDHAKWLQEQDIKPNSFEKAAMDYYGVSLERPEHVPPWRRLMDIIKELEKEHGLEVPEDIAIAAAAEVGIENPEDLIGELKREGVLYSPAKGAIARVEREKPREKEVELPGKLPKVFWGKESKTTREGIMLKRGLSLESFSFFHELAHWLVGETDIDTLHPLVHDAYEKEGNIVKDIYFEEDLDEIIANVYARYKKAPEKIRTYPLWMKVVNVLEDTYRMLAGEEKEIHITKEYATMAGFMRGVRSAFKRVFGHDDYLTLVEDDKTVEERIKSGELVTHSEGGKELGYILGWDIEFPDRIYVYYTPVFKPPEVFPEKVEEAKEEIEEKMERPEETLIGEETMKRVKKVINHWMSTEERRKNTCELELNNFIKVITAHTAYTPDLVSRGIDELKAEGILFSPSKDEIRRTSCEDAWFAPEEETEPIPPIPTNLIPYEEALRAYEGISQTPERSAEVVINDFYNSIRSIYDELSKYAESETQKSTLDYYIKEFAEEYATRYRAILRQKAGLISPMVAGPSKFPAERMRKLSEKVDRRERELLDWIEKQKKRMKKDIEEVAIEEEGGEVAHLRNEIAKLNEKLERMKAINKVVKSKSLSDTEKRDKLAEMGYPQPEIEKLLTPDYMGQLGFPDYTLTSIRSKIKTREERIETLTKKEEKKKRGEEIIYERYGLKIVENPDVDRYQLLYEEKPDKALRDELKKKGFKWSPTNKAWQRMVTSEALYVIENQIIPQWEEKEVPVEYKEGEIVHYEPYDKLASPLSGEIIEINRTKQGIRYTIKDDEGETYDIYDYKGEITSVRGKPVEEKTLSVSELKQKYLAIPWNQFVDDVFQGKVPVEPCVEYVDLPHLLVHKITVGPAEEVKYGAVWDVRSYDKEGNILVEKGFKTKREAFLDFHSYIRDSVKQEQAKEEIPEEKWENVTKEKLEETRRTSKFSEKYAISQAKAGKKVSATEETVYEKLPDELDLGPYSDVLLYTPVEEIRYLSKAERGAFIKLVDRGWFQVYRVSKPVSDKYPSGFTYVLKKTREEEELPEEPEKVPEETLEERVLRELRTKYRFSRPEADKVRVAIENYRQQHNKKYVEAILEPVRDGKYIADDLIAMVDKEEAKTEIEEKIKPLKPLITGAEVEIDECDKGFETCLEFCDDDLEACYEECVEKEESEDIAECNKRCEEKRDECHDKCEEDALPCYDDSAREIIGVDIEEGDLTKAEEDLETFQDYISDELYEELNKRIGREKPAWEEPPREPPVILHECVYKDEVIEKLKTKDWEEKEGYAINKEHNTLFLYDKDAALKPLPFLPEYETAEFFTLLKAPYKEWRHVEFIPYKDYGLDHALIVELIRILYGGFSGEVMGKIITGFLPTAKPIIVHIPYKDDCAVFIIAPLVEREFEETEIYGEKHELDYTTGDKPTYYDLERQIFGFYVEDKIISIDEYREQVRAEIKPPKEIEEIGITVYSIARPLMLSAVKDYGIIKQVELKEKKLPKEYAVLLERRPPNELLERWDLFVLEPVTTEEVMSALGIDEPALKLFAEDIKSRGFDAVVRDATVDIFREARKEIKWKQITEEDAKRVAEEILKKAEKLIEKVPEKVPPEEVYYIVQWQTLKEAWLQVEPVKIYTRLSDAKKRAEKYHKENPNKNVRVIKSTEIGEEEPEILFYLGVEVEKKREHEFGIEVYRAGTWHLTHSPGLGYKTYDEAEERAIELSEATGESHRVVEYDYEGAARYDIKSYPTVEVRPPEKVKIHGIPKTRYRCPICYRAAPENFCVVHSDVEAIDLLAADEPVKESVIDLTFLDLFKTIYPEKKRWTVDELHEAIGIDIDYTPEFLAKPRIPETYAQYYARELGVEIEEIKPPEVVRPPVEERSETQEVVYEYFKKEVEETDIEAYQHGYLDALRREIGREFREDHLLLADSEELYRLMDLRREELEAELRRRLTPVPPSVEELAETERLEILRKMRKYKRVTAEVPELKIGATVTMNDKTGIIVDVSANKYRVNWDDGTWDWIMKKNSEVTVVY